MKIIQIMLLMSATSCSLITPEVVEIAEEVAEEVVDEVAEEIVAHEQNKQK